MTTRAASERGTRAFADGRPISRRRRFQWLRVPEPPDQLVATERALRGIEALPFDEAAAFQGRRLPHLHRDPFDRMLIAQAIALGLAIVTPDPLISQYPVRVIW
jgi:PIN domain nuclease of toxin-antitoxin system